MASRTKLGSIMDENVLWSKFSEIKATFLVASVGLNLDHAMVF